MKIAGIIAEYNPFHTGHARHLNLTRQLTGADYIIVVMSGDFVQRGEPALFDKYERTRMALTGGADLVLELPVPFATGSAGDFAAGAVRLLDQLHCVDFLCFGSECGQIRCFQTAADELVRESPAFRTLLQEGQKKGLSYPMARSHALLQTTQADLTDLPEDFFTAPNNILGLEYCLALSRFHSSIAPVTMERKGDAYLESSWAPGSDKDALSFPSALALRCLLSRAHSESGRSSDFGQDGQLNLLKSAVLPQHLPLFAELLSKDACLFPADFSKELRYRLLTEPGGTFARYADVSRSLADKIKKGRTQFQDWNDLCSQLKSREITYSRVSRALCHILLSVTADQLQQARDNGYVSYARILGFQKAAAPLLSAVRKSSALPLLTKLADAVRSLSGSALEMLEKDILAAEIYEGVLADRQRRAMRPEISRGPVIITG